MKPFLLTLLSAAVMVAISAVHAETLKSAADNYGISIGGIVGNGSAILILSSGVTRSG